MQSFILENSKMSTLFKKFIAFDYLDDDIKKLEKLIEIKDIVFDVIEDLT